MINEFGYMTASRNHQIERKTIILIPCKDVLMSREHLLLCETCNQLITAKRLLIDCSTKRSDLTSTFLKPQHNCADPRSCTTTSIFDKILSY